MDEEDYVMGSECEMCGRVTALELEVARLEAENKRAWDHARELDTALFTADTKHRKCHACFLYDKPDGGEYCIDCDSDPYQSEGA